MDRIKDTFLSIVGKSKDEVLITKMVAYILNPANTTLEIIEKILISTQSEKDSADFVKLLKDKDNHFWNITTENSEDISGTVDIVMKATKFWIIIENKINAQETGNQSDRYAEVEKKQEIPIKYIHLKPDYNHHKLKNNKFVEFSYSQLLEILKSIEFTKLNKEESYTYITDIINHIENFLIGEYSDNWKKIKSENKYKTSNNLSNMLLDKLKDVFDTDNAYSVNFYEKFNCFQIWKNSWNSSEEIISRRGIHYEIVFRDLSFYELNYVSKKNVEVSFVIHNESKGKNKIPLNCLKRETFIYASTYNLEDKESIKKSVESIALKMKELSEKNDSKIEQIVSKYRTNN